MNHTYRGHILALITQAIWSSTFVVSKLLLDQLTPLQVLIARFLLAVAFLSVLSPRFQRPAALREELMFLGSGIALALYFLFENTALQKTWSTNVSLIIATIPLLTGLLAVLVLRTRLLQARSLLGLVIAYGGVFVVMAGSQRFAGVNPAGDLLAFGAALMFAAYSLLLQKVSGDYPAVGLTRKVFVYVLLALSVAAAASGQPVLPRTLSAQAAFSLLYLGIAASSCGFLLWNIAIKAIGPVRTSQYIYLAPVMTIVLSAIVLKERITVFTVLGTALILAGLYWAERSRPLPAG